MKRKTFLKYAGLSLGIGAFQTMTSCGSSEAPNIFSEEEIREFVFAAHEDFDETKRIIEKKPLILNCADQFHKGDFETAMGGAAHMGRRDIADLLVDRGARLDLFQLTFLGHLSLVKNLIQVSPQYLQAPGPHGYTLLHHALVGERLDFAKWLKDQGLETERFENVF